MPEYLVFESNRYFFALPRAAVLTLTSETQPDSTSFCKAIFGAEQMEEEPYRMVLANGLRLRVHDFTEMIEWNG